MKNLFYSLFLTAGLLLTNISFAESQAQTKRVCVEQTDPKTGKLKEVCRTITVHKKLDGTKVPEKK